MPDVPKNVEVKYHGVSWTTTIIGANTIHEPDVNFACHFDRFSDETLFYDITWYVDDTEVLTNQTVSSNSSDIPLLLGTQIIAGGKKANSMVYIVLQTRGHLRCVMCKANCRKNILYLTYTESFHILIVKCLNTECFKSGPVVANTSEN